MQMQLFAASSLGYLLQLKLSVVCQAKFCTCIHIVRGYKKLLRTSVEWTSMKIHSTAFYYEKYTVYESFYYSTTFY